MEKFAIRITNYTHKNANVLLVNTILYTVKNKYLIDLWNYKTKKKENFI